MKKTKTAYIIIANAATISLLVIGLLSPVTPSEGTPFFLDVAIFAGGPLFITGTADVEKVANAIDRILRSDTDIHDIRWWTEDKG